jgi:hypothetical protein
MERNIPPTWRPRRAYVLMHIIRQHALACAISINHGYDDVVWATHPGYDSHGESDLFTVG